jgi:hypothetical protein
MNKTQKAKLTAQLEDEITVEEQIIAHLAQLMPASTDTIADQLLSERVEQLIHASADRRRDLQLTIEHFTKPIGG